MHLQNNLLSYVSSCLGSISSPFHWQWRIHLSSVSRGLLQVEGSNTDRKIRELSWPTVMKINHYILFSKSRAFAILLLKKKKKNAIIFYRMLIFSWLSTCTPAAFMNTGWWCTVFNPVCSVHKAQQLSLWLCHCLLIEPFISESAALQWRSDKES